MQTEKMNWNVISEEEFKERVSKVFENVANSLSKTLGPYGATTIIEKYGDMHITKDGWQVLKNIKFNNMIDNNILMLLLRISAQVVIKVGDGSTSSIVAANAILKEIQSHESLKSLRSKELMDILSRCCNEIIARIYENSTKIDKDTYDEIYNLAYISTNGDEEISNIIKDIYVKTGNPSIEFNSSKTNKTSYEIIDGYRANNVTYLDCIFATNDDGTCVIDEPYILMFDHKIDMDTATPIISAAAMKASEDHKRLVVIAPYYDKFLLEYIRKNINIEFRSRGTSTVVYARASLINNMSHEMYNDFAIICGAEVIREQFVSEMKPEEVPEYLGMVKHMVIGEKSTFVNGFINRNDTMYNKIIVDATAKYNNMLADNEAKGIVDIKLHEYKQRLTKLRCHMGVINVGGNSELEKTANYDLVEDAVKACESAFNFGYNIGGSLVIPQTILRIDNEEPTSEIEMKYGSTLYNDVLDAIYGAFVSVYETVIRNKYKEEDAKVLDILADTEMNEYTKCYNLITDEFTTDVINSCETDIEILKASISIISLLMSSNQYITITNPDDK